MTLKLNPERIARVLTYAVVVLVALGILRASMESMLTKGGLRDTMDRVSLDGESNLAMWFSSALLLCCSALLFILWLDARQRGDRLSRGWGLLAAVFALLSVDEAVALHELATGPLRNALGTNGLLRFAWVIPGTVFVFWVLAACLRLIQSLPKPHRARVLMAGAFYVGGALVLEMAGSYGEDKFGYGTLQYWLPTVLEETFEMVGICLFLVSLIRLAGARMPAICIQLESADVPI